MGKIKALFITGTDPWAEPRGGQATFAKHLLNAYGDSLAISSTCELNVPVGIWFDRSYKAFSVKFLSRGSLIRNSSSKPFIPLRVYSYLRARKHMAEIYNLGIINVITDSPEFLFAMSNYHWDSVCYRFAGVNNPVSFSRYPWLRFLGGLYEFAMMRILRRLRPDVMLASADQRAINELFVRTNHILDRDRFFQFPTRVDTDMFCSLPKLEVRRVLGISSRALVLVATGRLCWIKGWDLLLASLALLKEAIPDILLVFVGDGEDKQKIEQEAERLGVLDNIFITGFLPQVEVANYINASDICTVASYREGWSLAMCEVLACGRPIVSTDVSGALDMVHDDKNGYIVKDRDPYKFADAVLKTLKLKNATDYSLHLSDRYAAKNLARDLGALWQPLKGHGY